jgi:hypothetical protein
VELNVSVNIAEYQKHCVCEDWTAPVSNIVFQHHLECPHFDKDLEMMIMADKLWQILLEKFQLSLESVNLKASIESVNLKASIESANFKQKATNADAYLKYLESIGKRLCPEATGFADMMALQHTIDSRLDELLGLEAIAHQ